MAFFLLLSVFFFFLSFEDFFFLCLELRRGLDESEDEDEDDEEDDELDDGGSLFSSSKFVGSVLGGSCFCGELLRDSFSWEY